MGPLLLLDLDQFGVSQRTVMKFSNLVQHLQLLRVFRSRCKFRMELVRRKVSIQSAKTVQKEFAYLRAVPRVENENGLWILNRPTVCHLPFRNAVLTCAGSFEFGPHFGRIVPQSKALTQISAHARHA